MTGKDYYCWLCHRNRVDLPCKVCFRNYHFTCVKAKVSKLSFIFNKSSGYNEFEDRCPECLKLDDAAKKWDSGLEFERISQKTLDNLLLAVWSDLQKDAPEPFLWPVSKFIGCPIQMNLDKIKQKASDSKYKSPREFFADIRLINHNCASIFNNGVPGSDLVHQMNRYKTDILNFIKIAELKIQCLEACPHCIINFYYPDIWLTLTCPWGHPIILVDLETQLENGSKLIVPAKLIRFYRDSQSVDIILFGYGERKRVAAEKCWMPCLSDLDSKGNSDLEVAYQQVKEYISSLKEKFKKKFRLPKKTRALKATDKDYVYKEDSSDDDMDSLSDAEPDECANKNGVKVEVNSFIEGNCLDIMNDTDNAGNSNSANNGLHENTDEYMQMHPSLNTDMDTSELFINDLFVVKSSDERETDETIIMESLSHESDLDFDEPFSKNIKFDSMVSKDFIASIQKLKELLESAEKEEVKFSELIEACKTHLKFFSLLLKLLRRMNRKNNKSK